MRSSLLRFSSLRFSALALVTAAACSPAASPPPAPLPPAPSASAVGAEASVKVRVSPGGAWKDVKAGSMRDGMDPSVPPGADFYRYANGAWLAATEIPKDRSSWGVGAQVTELTDERSFQTAETTPLDDEDDPAGHALVERSLSLFARLVALTDAEIETPDAGHPQLSYALAARFELSPMVKQPLLEDRSERQRLEQVCDLLDAAQTAIERQREIARRAGTNGKH